MVGITRRTLISIVDDDGSVRESMKSLVKSLGFAAAAYSSAEDFLALGLSESSGCLIADVQMPGMSGLDLYRQLVASGRLIPTILITAYPDERIRARALEAGVICYLEKPFNETDLIACIRSAFARHGVDSKLS